MWAVFLAMHACQYRKPDDRYNFKWPHRIAGSNASITEFVSSVEVNNKPSDVLAALPCQRKIDRQGHRNGRAVEVQWCKRLS